MSEANGPFGRRDFLKTAGAAGLSLSLANSALAGRGARTSSRVLGANDRINVGVIGVGGRGSYVGAQFARIGQKNNSCQIVAVCDVYEKRKRIAAEKLKADGYMDYREVLARPDVDAVIVATPDHWHAKIALDAMDRGKDVYLEKPMCHTNEEIKQLVNTVKETKRVLQVGSQTTSGDQWWKARKAIADGMIGQMLMSQGSYHRNSTEGEWNWTIEKDAGPDGKGDNYIDWKTWLGPAPKRPFDADRFFRFRKYWDYSGGIATDLFYHVVAPLQICWGEAQFPTRVSGMGGIYVFKDEREVPDTFNLMADYAAGHSLVLSSSMANSHHIPGLIRGHEGTIIMVENGQFESRADYITVIPETKYDREKKERATLKPEYQAKFGKDAVKIPVDPADMMNAHIENFLTCMHTREKPHLDVETGARAQAVINLAVQSYREGHVLFWDEKNWKASTKPVKA
ncbi:MAG TPA: Gfo/Idh/MocA family oxidoreductase [Bryobacteraceae bacterium]|nr:Gfo/Idh/MocA family oxidoreductase [Bryobacteraceae bacterium]